MLDRLGEAQVVDLHHEVDDVTALTAAEAVIKAELRANVEGGRALVVERAQALHRADSRRAQCHVCAHDLLDPGAFPDGGDVLHADPTGHGLTHPRTWTRAARWPTGR